MNKKEIIYPSHVFRKNPSIPGDKSISHRGLIFGALAQGRTVLMDSLKSADVLSTSLCLKQLGVSIEQRGNKTFIDGVGSFGLKRPISILDCGNSGTSMRLLMGVLAGQNFQTALTGDDSLRHRPMKRVADPLAQMGAKISFSHSEYAPLTITGGRLQAIDYDLKVPSAQIKSALILAGLLAEGKTCLRGKIDSRDHTERMLKDFGVHLDVSPILIRIKGNQSLKAATVQVPGDPSAAACWIAAATLIPGVELELENVSINPTRLGFVKVLQRMGADITVKLTSEQSEPIGCIKVGSSRLKGVRILSNEIPFLIDEIPLLAILASQASGFTQVEGASELRVKESDRLQGIAINLRAMHVEIETKADGFIIEGIQKLQGATIQTNQDHRIALAFSIAALVAQGPSVILDADCVKVSYPDFFSTLKELTQ